MISLDYSLSVPKFATSRIGYSTLVRCYPAHLEVQVRNDGQRSLRQLTVQPVLESYVGQEKALLFVQENPQTIDEITAGAMRAVTFEVIAPYPGLVAVAVHVSDSTGKSVMAKRTEEKQYQELPVRWWFHVLDDTAIETLQAIMALSDQLREVLKASSQRKVGKVKK